MTPIDRAMVGRLSSALFFGVVSLWSAIAASPLRAQDSQPAEEMAAATRPAEPAGTVFRVGKAYVNAGETKAGLSLLVRDGRLAEWGDAVTAPEGSRVVELDDAVVTPGLIDACVSVAAFESYKGPEHETECTPELRVIDSFDLNDPLLRRLAGAGVTTIYVTAEPTAVIGAQGAILRTAGPVKDRVIKSAWGIKATIGREPMFRRGWNDEPWVDVNHMTRRPTTRMGLVWMIRKAFHDANADARGEDPGSKGEGSPTDRAIPFLKSAIQGDIPLRIQARKQLDIQSALRIANEFNFKFIIEEGTDAARSAAELKAAGAAVIYGPIFDYPTGFRQQTGEANRARYSAPSELIKAGVPLALTASDMIEGGALAEQAVYAMRGGLTREEALAAVTTTPAKLLGLPEGSGELAAGDATDLVVWSGEPFDATSRPLVVVAGGHIVLDRTSETGE